MESPNGATMVPRQGNNISRLARVRKPIKSLLILPQGLTKGKKKPPSANWMVFKSVFSLQ